MTNEKKWINHIKEHCFTDDPEQNHIEADNALKLFLISLGYTGIVEAWGSIKPKWYV